VAPLVECPTLDFGSGHDLRVMGLHSVLESESAWDSLPLPLSPHAHSLSKQQKKIF